MKAPTMSATPDAIRVLHVDDEPDFAEMAASFLEREDDRFEVATAISASDGVRRLADAEFDCIVSDYEIPGTDGIEFLETVREEYPNLSFILYTGKGSEEVASDAITAGVTDYLQKGVGTDQYTVLANRITNAVEHHRSQRTLAQRNQELRRYERMINSMHEAACIYDAAGRFELVNEYLADWYGTTRSELEGEWSSLIPHIREHAAGDPYGDLLAGNRDELQGELEGDFPRHGHAVLEYRLTPLTVDGTIEAVVGVARDVTERKERERELRERTEELEELTTQLEDQYRHLFEEAPVMAVVTRAEDGEPVIEDCNQLFVDTLGYDRSDVIGRDLAAFYTPESADALLDRGGYDRALSGEFVREDRTLLAVDGETVETLLRAVPRRDAGDAVTGTLAMYIDISERKKLEQETERLEQFTRVVSHDLRNPLNVAQGRLALAREECDSPHLEDVSRAHDRMSALIEDLLTLAREDGHVNDPEPVPLAELVESCWRSVETGDATIRTNVDQTIRADRSRLAQLLENLIRNSVEHGGTDVTVTVGTLDDGFYVEDTGPGIPEEHWGQVFDAGFSTAADGTGFGLSIVEQVADAHGWEVSIAASSDGGARFDITGVSVA
ncbi:PAS domain S-box protein [Halorubrum sp. CBA1125]|uniref:hybrid sensor histidine kinase/response regulator n=1 Tax=Halorubrum sp. CBA1125 TaxID=2668072 RepID=UPI0012E8F1EA|nr:PAS domain S-box protein [Halorubrum sp. CBA1125]MUW14350.1 PAS domain S-box protein [Halorubrum sp. CBA1125]